MNETTIKNTKDIGKFISVITNSRIGYVAIQNVVRAENYIFFGDQCNFNQSIKRFEILSYVITYARQH